MPRGGARPNSGGARVGAGRKATRPPVDRRVVVALSSCEAEVLERLERRLELSASDVLRRALIELYSGERQAATLHTSSRAGRGKRLQ